MSVNATCAWVVDGHCHLELLRQRVSVNATEENTGAKTNHEGGGGL